jgi:hypothetical protein
LTAKDFSPNQTSHSYHKEEDEIVNDSATNQALTHLSNIAGFLREIAADLKTINQRSAAKEARGASTRKPPTDPKPR